ncbi:MAG: hypothetical protein WBD24_05440 [Candidatus Omnitrophota bacterium]
MKKIAILTILISLCLQAQTFAGPDLKVTGIISAKRPMAVVDGITVQEGDMIGNAKVIGIGEDFVQFEVNNRVITRRVGEKSLADITKEKFAASMNWIAEQVKKLRLRSAPAPGAEQVKTKTSVDELMNAKEKARGRLGKGKEDL